MDPHETLVKASALFEKNPTEWGKALAELGRSEGYEYIRETVLMLQEAHADNRQCTGILLLLRQPDWQWRSCTNQPHLRFFGLPDANGEFIPQGYYIIGKYETGETKVLLRPGRTAHYVVGEEIITDPRESYVEKALKVKVWKRQNKYWLVLVGRVIDLVKYGISKEDIRETGGTGYFSRFPAFAVADGPYSKEEAQEAKSSLS
jgi:hypothetical protein